ncbi:MAG TPA: amidase domain-containing protein [Patescibacteria group bacterium]|nr:amidase domain-containing protein [Patescibacteria group bacterium]
MAVMDAAPAFADSGPVYTVVNPDHDATYSIYDRNSPHWADSNRKAPDFSRYGDRLELICGTNGDAVGPYSNVRWHYAKNLTHPEAGVTWIPDRYLNTPNKANQATPGEKECGSNAAAPNLGNKTVNPQTPEAVRPFTSYDRNAAKNWALAHAKDTPPDAGSCTWFVSQALAKGGFPSTAIWNTGYVGVTSEGHVRYGTDTARMTPNFLSYMRSLPYVEVRELGKLKTGVNNIPEAKPGDVIIYDWDGHGVPDHAVIVTGSAQNNSQYPLVSGQSEDGSKALPYNQRGWTWSAKHNNWIQVREPEVQAWIIHIRTEDELDIG